MNDPYTYIHIYIYSVAYVQKDGTAMGPDNACSYADIAFHPIDLLINGNEDYDIPLWARFKDDVFTPWTMGLEKLLEFEKWINSIKSKLKYKKAYSLPGGEGSVYLNTRAYIKNSKIQTTLYTKPSDTCAYTVPSSCHPKHVCMNIPNGVAMTIKRICSEESEYIKHRDIAIKNFGERGYNEEFVREIFKKYDDMDRKLLLGGPEINEELKVDSKAGSSRCIPLVLDFHPSFSGASKSLNKHKHLLDLDTNLNSVINKKNLFVTFRKSKSLGGMLVHSRYPLPPSVPEQEKGNKNCTKCILCKYYLVENCNKIVSLKSGHSFKIHQSISCTDEHVIYVIDDLICVRQNVGSTDINMRCRFANHKSHIKQKKYTCRVAKHYNEEKSHVFNIDKKYYDSTLSLELKVTLIDKVIPDPWDSPEAITAKMVAKESFWQNQLQSLESDGGLNSRNERIIARNKKANA